MCVSSRSQEGGEWCLNLHGWKDSWQCSGAESSTRVRSCFLSLVSTSQKGGLFWHQSPSLYFRNLCNCLLSHAFWITLQLYNQVSLCHLPVTLTFHSCPQLCVHWRDGSQLSVEMQDCTETPDRVARVRPGDSASFPGRSVCRCHRGWLAGGRGDPWVEVGCHRHRLRVAGSSAEDDGEDTKIWTVEQVREKSLNILKDFVSFQPHRCWAAQPSQDQFLSAPGVFERPSPCLVPPVHPPYRRRNPGQAALPVSAARKVQLRLL